MDAERAARAAKRKTVQFRVMEDDKDLEAAMALVAKDLSEPYSIFTYRSFI